MDAIFASRVKNVIHIIQIENFDENTPLGISLFMQRYSISTHKKVNYIKASNEYQISNWILSLENNDVILFPIYLDPLPLINKIIDKIRSLHKNIKIYACGTLPIEQYQRVLDKIKVDDIIINNDFPLLTFSKYKFITNKKELLKFFTHKNKIYLPNNFKFKVIKRNNSLPITFGSYVKCGKKCDFCFSSSQFSDLCKENFSFEEINKLIPNDIDLKNQKSIDVVLFHNNILNQYHVSDIKNFISIIRKKIKFKNIILYACAQDFIKYKNEILKLKNKDYRIVWRIGLESFSKTQLKRFNKNTLKYNLQIIKFFKYHNKGFILEPLFLIFDPWVTPKEIYESYYNFSKINPRAVSCMVASAILRSLSRRCWSPYPNTKMLDRALKEGLIKNKQLNNFYRSDSSDSNLCWKFENEKSEHIFFKLKQWDESQGKILKLSKFFDKCYVCCGLQGKHRKEYKLIEDKITQWIKSEGLDKDIEQYIQKKLENLYNHFLKLIDNQKNN